MNVLIRKATPDDAAALLAHDESIRAEEVYTLSKPGEFARTLAQEKEWISQMSDHPHHLLLVAEVAGKVIGTLDLTNGHRERIAHTGEFAISLDRPYRNQGIGRKLIESMLQWARENPMIEKITLKVHADNERAIHLYQRMGFVQEGYLRKELKYGPNQYVDTLIFSTWV